MEFKPTTRYLAMNARGLSTEVEDVEGSCQQHGKTFFWIVPKIEVSVNSKLYGLNHIYNILRK